VIRLQGLRKRFRRSEVLRGIDLEIERGQRVALIGSNGAGKTTLIRCLLGEYLCDGEVWIDGRDPRAARQEVLAKVGFVPQLPPPLRMPVGQLIRFVADVCGADAGNMFDVASRLGLDAERFRHHPFVQLSGGQKQKMLIALALGRSAELLIMDEPAANLDPEARRTFFQLLAERQDEAVMLISSHRLDEVASLVNRVIELDQGRVVLDDRVADLVELTSSLQVRLRLRQPDDAFARAIAAWSFRSEGDDGMLWLGQVAGPDRLRFLGMISRYAGLLADFEIHEQGAAQRLGVVHG